METAREPKWRWWEGLVQGIGFPPLRAWHRQWLLRRGEVRVHVGGIAGRFRVVDRLDYAHTVGRHFERRQLGSVLGLLRDDDVVYEVGAHIGTWTVFLARRAARGRVHAFEPEASNRERLAANVTRNALGNVDVHAIAATNENGTVDFGVRGRGGDGRHSLVVGEQHAGVVQVPALRLDDAPERLEIARPTALKIDVEGAEWLVLDGARGLLADDRVRVIYVEVHPDALRRTGHEGAEIEDLLADRGFAVRARWTRDSEAQYVFAR